MHLTVNVAAGKLRVLLAGSWKAGNEEIKLIKDNKGMEKPCIKPMEVISNPQSTEASSAAAAARR